MLRSTKSRRLLALSAAVGGVVSMLGLAKQASAQTLQWDNDPITPGVQNGSGIWDLSNLNWLDATRANVPWTNTGLSALFGGTVSTGFPGVITLGTNIVANNLT